MNYFTRLPLASAKWVRSTISSLYCLLLYASALLMNLGIIKNIGMGGIKPVTAGWEAQILPLCCVFYFYFITMFVKKLFDKTKTDCSDCSSSLRTRDRKRNWLWQVLAEITLSRRWLRCSWAVTFIRMKKSRNFLFLQLSFLIVQNNRTVLLNKWLNQLKYLNMHKNFNMAVITLYWKVPENKIES